MRAATLLSDGPSYRQEEEEEVGCPTTATTASAVGVDDRIEAKSNPTVPDSWRNRLQWELRPSYPICSLTEPSGRRLNVEACFVPHGYWTLLLRSMLLACSLHVLYRDVSTYPPHNLYIYMGYLTHWGHVLVIFYFTASFLCALAASTTRTSKAVLYQPLRGRQSPSRLVQWTWVLYSTVAPLQVAITALYWASLATGPPTYISGMEHGGLAALVWIDGLVLGRIPVRAKHVRFLVVLCLVYCIWSIVDVVAGIGGGEWGPADTDDALYPVLRWGRETKQAAILSAFAICILAPSLFLISWAVSWRESGSCCYCCCCCYGCFGMCEGLGRAPLYHQEEEASTKEVDDAADDTGFDYNEIDRGSMV